MAPSVTGIQVENQLFPPTVKPPGTTKNFFLAGAGARSGSDIEGKFVKFEAIGAYLEDSAVETLAVKWKGKTAEELTESDEFLRDVVTGSFEKFAQVTMISPSTGRQYSEVVAESCVAHLKAVGVYNNAEEKAIEKFLEVFKDQTFQPGSSIFFIQLPDDGSLKISFSKDHSVPEDGNVVMKNKHLAEAVPESIIGASPEARQSLVGRVVSDLGKLGGKHIGVSPEASLRQSSDVVGELVKDTANLVGDLVMDTGSLTVHLGNNVADLLYDIAVAETNSMLKDYSA